jgi:hypothetical protein
MEWKLFKDSDGQAIEKAKLEPLYYSFILTTESRKPWFVYKIPRRVLDDYYQTDADEATLEKANNPKECAKFILLADKMRKLGFRSSTEGQRYEISNSQFERFFD